MVYLTTEQRQPKVDLRTRKTTGQEPQQEARISHTTSQVTTQQIDCCLVAKTKSRTLSPPKTKESDEELLCPALTLQKQSPQTELSSVSLQMQILVCVQRPQCKAEKAVQAQAVL